MDPVHKGSRSPSPEPKRELHRAPAAAAAAPVAIVEKALLQLAHELSERIDRIKDDRAIIEIKKVPNGTQLCYPFYHGRFEYVAWKTQRLGADIYFGIQRKKDFDRSSTGDNLLTVGLEDNGRVRISCREPTAEGCESWRPIVESALGRIKDLAVHCFGGPAHPAVAGPVVAAAAAPVVAAAAAPVFEHKKPTTIREKADFYAHELREACRDESYPDFFDTSRCVTRNMITALETYARTGDLLSPIEAESSKGRFPKPQPNTVIETFRTARDELVPGGFIQTLRRLDRCVGDLEESLDHPESEIERAKLQKRMDKTLPLLLAFRSIRSLLEQMNKHLEPMQKLDREAHEAHEALLQSIHREVANAGFVTHDKGPLSIKALGGVLLTSPQDDFDGKNYIGIAAIHEPAEGGYSLLLCPGGGHMSFDRPTIDRLMKEAVETLSKAHIKITSIEGEFGRHPGDTAAHFKAWQEAHKR